MLFVSEALRVADTLLRDTTQTDALGIPPEFCTPTQSRARSRDTFIAAHWLRAAPPAEF